MTGRYVLEVSLHWVGVALYILATVSFAFGVVFGKSWGQRTGMRLAAAGLVPHAAALAMRWASVGHGPYVLKYEVLSSDALVAIAALLLVLWRRPAWGALAIVAMPVSILAVAMGLFSNPETRELPPSLRSIWLVFHIIFAKISASAFLVSLASAVLLLLRQRKPPPAWLVRVPEAPVLDAVVVRAVSFGMIFWTVTIAAGAIWGNQSWGRYWGWDPIETWALVSWLTYGSFLHVRFFFKPSASTTAWLSVGCFVLFIVALLLLPFFMSSLHSSYFS